MNSASMATNLLGRSVRLKQQPEGCRTCEGSITLVSIDAEGVHFLLLVDGHLITADSADEFTVLE